MFRKQSAEAIERLRSAYHNDLSLWNTLPLRRRSAVLVLLFYGKLGELRVLLSVRSRRLYSFPGHVAFPGGRAEPGEEPFDTARREAFEEIGLPQTASELPPHIKIEHLGVAQEYLSRNLLAVAPCVALLSFSDVSEAHRMIRFNLNREETSTLFSMPLKLFLTGNSLASYRRSIPIDEETRQQFELQNFREMKYKSVATNWGGIPYIVHHFGVKTRTEDEAEWLSDIVDYSGSDGEAESDPEGTTAAKRDSDSSEAEFGTDRLSAPPSERAVVSGKYRNCWGLTAAILVNVARVAYGRPPLLPKYSPHSGDADLIRALVAHGEMGEQRKEWEREGSFKDVLPKEIVEEIGRSRRMRSGKEE